jgi:recombinational DNA repair protein RecR
MAKVNKCDVCGTIYEDGECPKCLSEREHSKKMNDEAVERIKKEALTQEQADEIERAFFEDDVEIKLRDGKKYKVPPCSLKNARKLMKLLKSVNVDMVILNYVPTGDSELDEKRANDLVEILSYAFVNYPDINRDYIEDIVDVDTAKKIVEVLIGINSIKK